MIFAEVSVVVSMYHEWGSEEVVAYAVRRSWVVDVILVGRGD